MIKVLIIISCYGTRTYAITDLNLMSNVCAIPRILVISEEIRFAAGLQIDQMLKSCTHYTWKPAAMVIACWYLMKSSDLMISSTPGPGIWLSRLQTLMPAEGRLMLVLILHLFFGVGLYNLYFKF